MTDFIDYITGPERPPMTIRQEQQQSRHTHGSLDPMNWTEEPLKRHMTQEHGVWVPTKAVKAETADRHMRLHPEGEDRSEIV